MKGKAEHYKVFFEFPESPIRGIPLMSDDELLSFGFVEVGCTHHKKRGKLKSKKELFFKYWGDVYRKGKGITWYPHVFRALAHYHPETPLPEVDNKYKVDTVITCVFINKDMLESLTPRDHAHIFRLINSEPKRRSLLENILATADADRLHSLIIDGGDNPHFAHLRGYMAEIIIQKSIELVLPDGISMYKNSDIRYFNKRFENGTELDAIMTFYGTAPYHTLVDKLRTLPHLDIKSDLL